MGKLKIDDTGKKQLCEAKDKICKIWKVPYALTSIYVQGVALAGFRQILFLNFLGTATLLHFNFLIYHFRI